MTLDQPYVLVPHPWDALGTPPPPGAPSGGEDDLEALLTDWLDLLDEANELSGEAEAMHDDALAKEKDADKAYGDASDLADKIAAIRPAWRSALDEGRDPRE